ncbi:hypothetical protein PRNP1_002017 [Phytophthora ramorum]
MKVLFIAAMIAAVAATASADSMGNISTDLTQPPTATYAAGTDVMDSSTGTTDSGFWFKRVSGFWFKRVSGFWFKRVSGFWFKRVSGFWFKRDTGFWFKRDTGFWFKRVSGFWFKRDTGFWFKRDTGFWFKRVSGFWFERDFDGWIYGWVLGDDILDGIQQLEHSFDFLHGIFHGFQQLEHSFDFLHGIFHGFQQLEHAFDDYGALQQLPSPSPCVSAIFTMASMNVAQPAQGDSPQQGGGQQLN